MAMLVSDLFYLHVLYFGLMKIFFLNNTEHLIIIFMLNCSDGQSTDLEGKGNVLKPALVRPIGPDM
jgi:hypothetical protein